MTPIQLISQDLFDKVRSRFQKLEMGDETGAVTIDPVEARFFDFDFVNEGVNLGRVSISLNDLGSLKIYYSQGITENQDDPAKKIWYSFLKEMRLFAMRRLMRFDTRDIAKSNLDKKDFQHLAVTQAQKEEGTNMNESKWNEKSSKKTSRAVRGGTEVIVRHFKPVDEMYSGSRSRKNNIKGIYIQNRDGERFKYPFIHPAGAFAMAQHVDHGGVPHDPAGKAIVNMSEQIAQLQEFSRQVQHTQLHDDAMGITERAVGRLQELKARMEALSKRQHYESWIQEFQEPASPMLGELDDVTMETYKQKFTQTNFKEELSSFFPLIHSIMQETNEVNLDEYISEGILDKYNSEIEIEDENGDLITVGVNWQIHGDYSPSTWGYHGGEEEEHPELEFTKVENAKTGEDIWRNLSKEQLDYIESEIWKKIENDDMHENMQPNRSPANEINNFEAWADATEQGKLTDDQIEDLRRALAELKDSDQKLQLGPDGEVAWQFFSEFGLEDGDLEEKLRSSAEVDPETDPIEVLKVWATDNYPELLVSLGMSDDEENADRVAEEPMDMDNQSNEKPDMIKEVAKIVKSFYNRDNPEVGPFRGNEGIALDVEKQISEKFGDQAGQHARQMAEQFMEKLTTEWQTRHGQVGAVEPTDGLARLKELVGNIKTKVEGMGEAGPDKSQIPAVQRKEKGGDWKMSTADLEKEKNKSPTTPAGLAQKKKDVGIAEATTKIAQKESALEAIIRLSKHKT